MNMTHYMELLATNQPWNLLLFMAIPVILAETIAIAELWLLFTRRLDSRVALLSRIAGVTVGIYFVGIFGYLMATAVIPLTANDGWRGFIDIVAVISYLLGVVPLAGIALLDLRILGRRKTPEERLKLHAAMVGLFLVVAHIAMIFGMADPTLFQGQMPSDMSESHGTMVM
jgi:hypothetical protein